MSIKTPKSNFLDASVLIGGPNGYDNTTTPSNETKITASDGAANDRFGASVAVGSGRIVIGAPEDDDNGSNSGAAYIFDLEGNQLAKIKASDGWDLDYFGGSIAVGCGRIVVGAWPDDIGSNTNQGSAYIFDLEGNQLAKITASDGEAYDAFGISVAVGSGRIVVGAMYDNDNGGSSGSAYIYDLNGNELAKIKASDGGATDYFGTVAVGSGRIVVGAWADDDNGTDSGSAYIFDLDGTQLAKITASDGEANDNFGQSVAVGSGRIVVGALYHDITSSDDKGSAYIFDLDGNQLAKITASDAANSDYFGSYVAVRSGRIVVGAPEDDDNGSNSGSAYIFDLDGTQLAKIKPSDGAASDQFGWYVAVGSGRIVVGARYDDDNGSNSGSAYIWDTPKQTHFLDHTDE